MGFFDALGKYMSEGEETRKRLMEECKYSSDYELFHQLGRILQKNHSNIKRNGSVSAVISNLNLPASERMKYAAIKSLLQERGYAESEIMTRAVDSY